MNVSLILMLLLLLLPSCVHVKEYYEIFKNPTQSTLLFGLWPDDSSHISLTISHSSLPGTVKDTWFLFLKDTTGERIFLSYVSGRVLGETQYLRSFSRVEVVICNLTMDFDRDIFTLQRTLTNDLKVRKAITMRHDSNSPTLTSTPAKAAVTTTSYISIDSTRSTTIAPSDKWCEIISNNVEFQASVDVNNRVTITSESSFPRTIRMNVFQQTPAGKSRLNLTYGENSFSKLGLQYFTTGIHKMSYFEAHFQFSIRASSNHCSYRTIKVNISDTETLEKKLSCQMTFNYVRNLMNLNCTIKLEIENLQLLKVQYSVPYFNETSIITDEGIIQTYSSSSNYEILFYTDVKICIFFRYGIVACKSVNCTQLPQLIPTSVNMIHKYEFNYSDTDAIQLKLVCDYKSILPIRITCFTNYFFNQCVEGNSQITLKNLHGIYLPWHCSVQNGVGRISSVSASVTSDIASVPFNTYLAATNESHISQNPLIFHMPEFSFLKSSKSVTCNYTDIYGNSFSNVTYDKPSLSIRQIGYFTKVRCDTFNKFGAGESAYRLLLSKDSFLEKSTIDSIAYYYFIVSAGICLLASVITLFSKMKNSSYQYGTSKNPSFFTRKRGKSQSHAFYQFINQLSNTVINSRQATFTELYGSMIETEMEEMYYYPNKSEIDYSMSGVQDLYISNSDSKHLFAGDFAPQQPNISESEPVEIKNDSFEPSEAGGSDFAPLLPNALESISVKLEDIYLDSSDIAASI